MVKTRTAESLSRWHPDRVDDQLQTVLERARSLGFLGPGSVASQYEHARRFLPGVSPTGRVLDLGSGGGLPGLVIAKELPGTTGVVFDGMEKRTTFLAWALRELGVDGWTVERGRAEDPAFQQEWRGQFDVVTARGFGPPSATLECSLGLVRPGGVILISEPPLRRIWPTSELGELGYAVDTTLHGLVAIRAGLSVDPPPPRPWKRLTTAPQFDVRDGS